MNYIEKIIIFNCVPVCFFVWAQSSSLDIVNEANNIANPQCESPTIKSEQEKSTVTESNDNLSLEQSEKMKVLIGEYIREEFAKKQEEYDQKLLRFKEDFRREMEFKQKIDSAQNQPVFASELAQISKQPLPMMAQKSGLEIVSEINNDGTAKRFFTRESAVSLAKEKNQEIKAVKAEVISALSKRKEAGRQLFPHLFLEAGQTEGKLLENIEFEEKRYGLAVEHTLFHSGHLKNTYAQAKKQHEAARTRLSKIETDVAFTTTQNYYELVKALLNYKLQTVLAEEIQNDLTVTEEKFKQNLITEEEMLEVRTRYNQVNFQKLSAQRDTALARYKLMQTIGLTEKEAKTLDDVDTRIDFEGITVNLDNLQDEALTQRLDIKIAGLMVEISEYEKKIAKAKDGLKIDLNGFYGKSASYYRTETPVYNNDWNLLFKVSKSFGPNTVDYNFTKDETSPKLGQTDRTSTTSQRARVGLLDNFAKYSGINKAQAEYEKAVKDFKETQKEVSLEAYQAYFDYQEAIIRIANSQERIKLANQRLSSGQYQMGLGQFPLSQIIDAKTKLADEKSLYMQALADYKISLYKLDKAVGQEGKFSQISKIRGKAYDEK